MTMQMCTFAAQRCPTLSGCGWARRPLTAAMFTQTGTDKVSFGTNCALCTESWRLLCFHTRTHTHTRKKRETLIALQDSTTISTRPSDKYDALSGRSICSSRGPHEKNIQLEFHLQFLGEGRLD